MHIEPDQKFDFSDVLIRPKRSTLNSRADVDIKRSFRFLHSGKDWTGLPIIASNMDVVGTFKMSSGLRPFGAMVALHKHYPADALIEFFKTEESDNTFYSLGMTDNDVAKLRLVKTNVTIKKLCLDVANGYTEVFLQFVRTMRDENPDAVIMAGSVATGEMTEALILAGADIVRVGIGSGSVCVTRKVTGVGYPQLSAIIECADAAHGLKGHICSDGGCVVPGDIAKAFGGGADFVMIGGMLAGHDECEGSIRYENKDGVDTPVGMTFYGMSSKEAMEKHSGGVAEYRAAEGKSVETPYKGSVKGTIQEITGGLRSMMTYIGAFQLKEVPKRTTFIKVGRQLNNSFGE